MSTCLTLCATTRLAQTLRAGTLAGEDVWLTPQAMTVGQWLAQLAEELVLTGTAKLPQVLDGFAEQILWEQVIAAEMDGDHSILFDLPGMAASAAEAHALLRLWPLNTSGLSDVAPETRLFLLWQSAFLKRCRQGGWIDLTGFHCQLIDQLPKASLALPQHVVFAGFDRYSPLEERLIKALTAQGVTVEKCPAGPVGRSECELRSCADAEAECKAVVGWLQSQLADSPSARLAVIAPDLKSVRDRLEFLLDDAFVPGLLRPDAAEAARCYNFSLGRTLAELPLVATALDWLAIAAERGKIEQARLGQLLLRPGWSAAVHEADGRARLETAMRRELGYFTSLPALLRLAQRLATKDAPLCPLSTQHLADFAAQQATLPGRRQLPSLWVRVFNDLLEAIAWPGERPLSSHEFQARRAFLSELATFGRLDTVLGPINLNEALRRLRQLCRQRIFQPETRGQPSIQILGVLESAGLSFDAIWVMGMTDDVWPPAPRPNPLLPAEWLRQVGAPHASADVEIDFASRVHRRLLASAPCLIFSSAGMAGNRLLRPSPLVSHIPPALTPLPETHSLASSMAAQADERCEALEDAMAPAVAEGEKVSGGTWLLRAQAICPAWGFYQYRLGAEAMEEPVEGLDPAARGTLVHAALEAFWRQTQDSARLAELVGKGLPEAIAQAVATALDNFETERHTRLPDRFRELEAQRLQRLLSVWLAIEAAREQGFTVLACEKSAEMEIEQIKVRMVVDRIDQLQDGQQIIIDYKTGATIDIHNWAETRLTEPQLPIYAALVAVDPVQAVVFAKVLLDQPEFSGIAAESGLLPGVRGLSDEKQKIFDLQRFPDWAAVLEHWRQALRQIALEVRAGVASVSFTDESALKYCEVKPLLRLAERARQQAAWLAEDAR